MTQPDPYITFYSAARIPTASFESAHIDIDRLIRARLSGALADHLSDLATVRHERAISEKTGELEDVYISKVRIVNPDGDLQKALDGEVRQEMGTRMRALLGELKHYVRQNPVMRDHKRTYAENQETFVRALESIMEKYK